MARNENELDQLQVLLDRGRANAVPLQEIDEKTARELEPRAKTFQKALYSPTTSTIDPILLMKVKREEAIQRGIKIHEDTAYQRKEGKKIHTTRGIFEADYIINCAGLYADQIAHDFGCGKNYRILPFKGLYLYSQEPPQSFRMHIYPVPDLDYPFLGVHVTVTVDHHAKIGPTAIPAFWREHYSGWDNFKAHEMTEILFREAGLLFSSGFDFARLAGEEMRKYSKKVLVHLASQLASGIQLSQYQEWGRPGIRAQLLDLKRKKLEMDFVVETGENSCHVLNAVSPGFTCAIPFSRYVCDKIESQWSGSQFLSPRLRNDPASIGESLCKS